MIKTLGKIENAILYGLTHLYGLTKSLKTNIGKYFFRLLNKHFLPSHKLLKIFNRNTLNTKIDGHNEKILENTLPLKTKSCNCLKKENCQMRGACLAENVLYYARVSYDDEPHKLKCCKGISETTFKKSLKNLLMRKKTRTILNYLLNTGR